MIDFHQSPEAMAKVLVQYIPDDSRVQSEVSASFGSKLHMSAIKELRAVAERRAAFLRADVSKPIDRSLTDKDRLYEDKMARASAALAERVIAHGWYA